MTKEKKTKFAVIGMGFIYPRHKAAIEENGGEILMTCDLDPTKGADFTDHLEMFASPKFREVDYVSICTPNYTHSAIVQEALTWNKQVICEKPLTIWRDYEGFDDVNVILQLRQNPKIQNLKAKEVDIYVKTYREPKYFESWKGKPELSGGILHNMGVHYIDLLGFILGAPVAIKHSSYSELVAKGQIEFERGVGTYHIELSKEPIEGNVIRKITIDGVETDLEGATIPLNDTGQVVNLHTKCYADILAGKGTKLSEARKSLELIARLRDAASNG